MDHFLIKVGLNKWGRDSLLPLVCGLLTVIISGIILFQWIFGDVELLGEGRKFVPMADETALLFFVFGLGLSSLHRIRHRSVLYFIRFVTLFILVVSIISLIDIWSGYRLNLSNFLGREHVIIGGIQTGRISFLTAICFILLATALQLQLGNTKQISAILSLLSLFIAYIVLIGYSFGVPILYGGTTIPMALLTAVLFIISSFGLIVSAGRDKFPFSYFTGDSVRARLMKVLIPVIFILSQIQSFFLSIYSGGFGSPFALTNGISSICLLLISGFIIFMISRSIGTSIDNHLADRLKAEEALKKSEEDFRSLAESMPHIVWATLGNGSNIYFNPQWVDYTGLTMEESYSNGWLVPVHPDDREKVGVAWANAVENKEVYSQECRIRRSDGVYRWWLIQGVPFLDETGKISKWYGTCTDIESIKEKEIKVSQLAAIVESSADIIISYSLDGVIITWNRGAELVYGYTASEMVGKPISVLSPPDSDDQTAQLLEKVTSGNIGDHFETVRQRKDGQLIDVSISISPIRNGEGNIIAASTIGHDITEHKRMEVDLRLKTEQLARLNAEKDKYFSIIAHDLRSPFSGFLGLTETMVKDLPGMTNKEIQEISLILHRSANSLYNLLGNLLEWSYMQRGFTNFVPSLFPLRSRFTASLSMTTEAATKKKIQITIQIPETLTVFADANMVDSIIRNIVNNAVKFTSRGGEIVISARLLPDNKVEISVQDSGIGMSPQLIGGLFSIDVNTARKGTDGESSTGLGLIICKDFIEKHGGKLWVNSDEGKGSTFRFTLPTEPDRNLTEL